MTPNRSATSTTPRRCRKRGAGQLVGDGSHREAAISHPGLQDRATGDHDHEHCRHVVGDRQVEGDNELRERGPSGPVLGSVLTGEKEGDARRLLRHVAPKLHAVEADVVSRAQEHAVERRASHPSGDPVDQPCAHSLHRHEGDDAQRPRGQHVVGYAVETKPEEEQYLIARRMRIRASDHALVDGMPIRPGRIRQICSTAAERQGDESHVRSYLCK